MNLEVQKQPSWYFAAVVCPDPLADLNGVFGNGTMLVHDKQYFYRGDTVKFLCDLGYGIEGVAVDAGPEEAEITCQNTGTWDQVTPKCVRK